MKRLINFRVILIPFLIGIFIQEGMNREAIAQENEAISKWSQNVSEVNNYLQDKKAVSLREILEMLEEHFEVTFLYKGGLIENKMVSKPDLQIGEKTGMQLAKIIDELGLKLHRINEYSYIVLPKQADKKALRLLQVVSGTVTDASTGESLPGVNVVVKGTTIGASTDSEGNYELEVPSLQDTLIFSFIGYQTQEIPINGRTQINVTLQAEVLRGEDVIVVGYGLERRREVSGSISSVSASDITEVQTTGVEEALQGQAPGVLVTSSSGQPGAPIDINIRGAASLGRSNPLYVIDGVPINNNTSTQGAGISNPLSTINPNNIESIEILKDASASAIYGSRGANGVVLITTKGGRRGQPAEVTISMESGVSKVPSFIDMMNSEQFAEFSREAFQNGGQPIPISLQEPLLSQNLQTNTNWQKEGFRTGLVRDFNMNVSGGGENIAYSIGTGFLDEEGTLPNSNFRRTSIRFKTDYFLNEKITIGESVELSRGVWSGRFNQTADVLQELLQSSPTTPVRNPDNLGGFAGPTNVTSPVQRSNRIAELTLTDENLQQSRLLGSAYVTLDILPNLTYRLNLGTDFEFGDSETFVPRFELGARGNPTADLSTSRVEERNFLIENTFTYNGVINEVHDFDILAGYTQQRNFFEQISGNVEDFPSNITRDIDAGTGLSSLSGFDSGWALQSVLGRIRYSYDETYNINFTIRSDGSSRFGEDSRWGLFPSVSASWNIDNEPFMEDINWLSTLKIRGSWGVTGSQDIPDFASFSVVEPVAETVFGESQAEVPGTAPITLGNSRLKWQETTKTDIGIDLGFLQERIFLTVDYYDNDTDQLLLRLPVNSTSGIRRNNGAFSNAGEVQNKGFEFSGSYQQTFNDFSVSLSGNLTTLDNEIKDLGTPAPIISSAATDLAEVNTITQVGGEIGAFFGHVVEGVFRDQAEVDNSAFQAGAAPGDLRFRDINNDGVIGPADRTTIGSPFPDFFYGFNLNLNYKNWDLGVNFDGVNGRDVYNLLRAGTSDPRGINNVRDEFVNRWTPNNRDSDIFRAVSGDPNFNLRSSTYFLEDASFLRLRNLSFGYTFNPPSVENWVDITRLRIYFSIKNLATFTDYSGFNPEVGQLTTGTQGALLRSVDFGGFPIPRTFQGGVEFSF